jgi:methionyl-tRNA synthetase
MKRNILVTAALPYANGDIHIGHLVEYLQTDYWVRFQKMKGHNCLYMCADDTHGTPIMISARDQGITPEELIAKSYDRHFNDFKDFEIKFDNYYTTNSPENKALSEEIFLALESKGHIEERPIEQLYCDHDKMFLPDRFVRGTCPKCGAENQYGDSCDNCSATYNPSDLKNSGCSLCGNPPNTRESQHLFVKLNHFKEYLQKWVKSHTSPEIANKLDEWLSSDLRDWDISRDAPYFGFEIPGHPGKFFYVWLDAPIGYIAATQNWCNKNNRTLDEFWRNEDVEIYHFIGKDIVYFHTLFWPALISNAGFQTPKEVFVHGFLTVNGEKMSKSKGTFIKARTYLDHLDPMYLRYYLACKMNGSIDDLDFNMDDIIFRVNSELIGKITNLASRSIKMLEKLDLTTGTLTKEGQALLKSAQDKEELISQYYENRDFTKVTLEIRGIAESANKYVDDKAPWTVIQQDEEGARSILTDIISIFRILAIYLKPILPDYVKKVEALLNEAPFQWEDSQLYLGKQLSMKPQTINRYEHLAKRIDKKDILKIIETTKADIPKPTSKKKIQSSPQIDFDTFSKVDLRVAKIIKAENIEKANKLLKLRVDLGPLGERTIMAGIKKYYAPIDLEEKLLVVVANLKPREMKFGTSEGMLLAASNDAGLFLLSPDSGAKPGDKIS